MWTVEDSISAFIRGGPTEGHHRLLISGEGRELVAHFICSFCGNYSKHDLPPVEVNHIIGVPGS